MPVFEVWQFEEDCVRRIAHCGSEADARMLMMMGDKQRSWIKCECEEVLLNTEDYCPK